MSKAAELIVLAAHQLTVSAGAQLAAPVETGRLRGIALTLEKAAKLLRDAAQLREEAMREAVQIREEAMFGTPAEAPAEG